MKDTNIVTEGIYREDETLRLAREKAMVYLSYSEHTIGSMYQKLIRCGFDIDAVNSTLEYLCDRGYINECDYFVRFCRHCAEKRGYGRARIELMAREKGFSKATVRQMSDEAFSKIDFLEICRIQLGKLKYFDHTDKKSRDKAIASLMRRGFSASDIREAIRLYVNEE